MVVDPAGEWLVQWRHRFVALGIDHLRSPSVHHPDPDPSVLAAFATEQRRTGEVGLASGEHLVADHVVWATNPAVVSPIGDCIPTSQGEELLPLRRATTVAVVGGGLTAAHLVAQAVDAGAHVEWVTRRPIVEREFDTDPGWLGPLEMQRFAAIKDQAERLRRVLDARGGGTVPPWMMRRLRTAEHSGQICRRVGRVEVETDEGGDVRVLVDGRRVVAVAMYTLAGV